MRGSFDRPAPGYESNGRADRSVGSETKKNRAFARVVFGAILYAVALTRGDAASDVRARIEALELQRRYEPSLAADLAGSDPHVAARAALAIGRIGSTRGIAPLRTALGTADPTVRAMAAYGLGLLADPSSLGDEVRLARVDPNSAVRYAAVDAIGRIVWSHTDAVARDAYAGLIVDGRTRYWKYQGG